MAARRRRDRTSAGSHQPASRGRLTGRRGLYAGLIVLVGTLTFASSLRGPFIFDDIASISDNTTIRSLWPLSGPLSPPARSESVAGRPLVNLSLALNYATGGLDVRGYHVANIAIHIVCALLVFAIVRRTLSDERLGPAVTPYADGLGAASALVWMVHPLASEPVDYIVARTESLMALFLLLTVYCAIRAASMDAKGLMGSKGATGSTGATGSRSLRGSMWLACAVGFCAAGMLCKETMVVAPLVVMLHDWTFERESFSRRRRFYCSLAATWLILATLIWSGPRAHSVGSAAADSYGTNPWIYLLNQTVIIGRYMRLLFWPIDLVLDYGLPRPLTLLDVWPYATLVLALLAFTMVALKRWPPVGFAAAWFFLTLAPSSSVVPIVTEVGAERRMYLPLMSLVVSAVVIVWLAIRRVVPGPDRAATVGPWLAAGVCGLLSLATLDRHRDYASGLTMWETVTARWPNGRAYSNLATELQAAGRAGEVIPALRQAVVDFPDAEYDLGAQLFLAGEPAEAIGHLDRFLRVRPDHAKAAGAKTLVMRAWTNVGVAFAAKGEIDRAVHAFEQALATDPASADLQRNLANALLDRRDFSGAERHAREALRLRPDDAVAKEILELAIARRESPRSP